MFQPTDSTQPVPPMIPPVWDVETLIRQLGQLSSMMTRYAFALDTLKGMRKGTPLPLLLDLISQEVTSIKNMLPIVLQQLEATLTEVTGIVQNGQSTTPNNS